MCCIVWEFQGSVTQKILEIWLSKLQQVSMVIFQKINLLLYLGLIVCRKPYQGAIFTPEAMVDLAMASVLGMWKVFEKNN